MQELLSHPSTRVTLDRHTQAVTPAKRLKLSGSTAVVAQFFPKGKTARAAYGVAKWVGNLCPFVPMRFLRNCRKLLVLSWRPRRDLNPCYRRERNYATRMATESGFSKGWKAFVDHKWSKKACWTWFAVVSSQTHDQELPCMIGCSRNFPNDIAAWRQHRMKVHASLLPVCRFTMGNCRQHFRRDEESVSLSVGGNGSRLSFLVGRRRLSLGLDFKPGCRRTWRGRLGRRAQPTKRPPGSWVRSLSNSEALLLNRTLHLVCEQAQ